MNMARTNYGFERLQREKEKAEKAQAKKQKKQDEKSQASAPDGEPHEVGPESEDRGGPQAPK
jgi:hypothetical protein